METLDVRTDVPGRRARLTGGLVAGACAGVFFAELVLRPAGDGPRALVVLIAALVGVVGICWCAGLWARSHASAHSTWTLAELIADRGDEALVQAVTALLAPVLKGRQSSAVPLAVHVGDEVVEVFWSGPPPPIARGFEPADTGFVWLVDRVALVAALDRPVASSTVTILPCLVSLGATGLGELWLNLEALRVARLRGPWAAEAAAYLRGLLVGCPVEVRTVGEIDPAVIRVGRRVDLADAVAQARRHRVDVRRSLEEHGVRSVPALRLGTPERSWASLAVFVFEVDGLDAGLVGDLVVAARGERSGIVCVLVGGEADAESFTIECSPGRLRLDAWGIDVAIANGQDGEVSGEPTPVDVPTWGDERSVHEQGVSVGVLGPVQIDGAVGALGGKGTELVAYLAMHPEGVSDERIKEALWPNALVQDKTMHNRVWATRQALGRNPAGGLALPHFESGVGRLDGVCTDVERLEQALVTGDADAAVGLRAALAMVRGRPFDERRGYQWAFAELHVAHAERVTVDAAHRLAELALDAEDWELARWAAEQGLLAVPASEVLVRDRMQAFAGGGNLRAIEGAFRDLVAGLADPDDVTGETRDLYTELRRRASDANRWS